MAACAFAPMHVGACVYWRAHPWRRVRGEGMCIRGETRASAHVPSLSYHHVIARTLVLSCTHAREVALYVVHMPMLATGIRRYYAYAPANEHMRACLRWHVAICMRICAYGSVCMRDGVSGLCPCMHACMSGHVWSCDFMPRCMRGSMRTSAGSYVIRASMHMRACAHA